MDPNNAPHVGGNTWAGGTGGRDTAGLGGKGGPYRLDAGHDVHQLSDEEKDAVPDDVKRAAREMGRRAFKQRLETATGFILTPPYSYVSSRCRGWVTCVSRYHHCTVVGLPVCHYHPSVVGWPVGIITV